MNYSKLLDKGLIHVYRGSNAQVEKCLQLARRDIKTSRRIMAEDWDWAFSIAYNAILQAGRALMFYKGYRPTISEGSHAVVVQFAEITLGKNFENEVNLFDKMRKKRHEVIYDVAGRISESEARQALEFAVKFIKIVGNYIEKKEKNSTE